MDVRTLPTYCQKRDKIASNDVNIYSDIQKLLQTVDATTSQMTLPLGTRIIYAFLPNASARRKDTVAAVPQ